MAEHFMNALYFLFKTSFEFYIIILLIRLILAYAQANYFNPITRLIIRLTQPLIEPLRRIIPNYRRIECSTVVLVFVIELIKIIVLSALTTGIPSILALMGLTLVEAIKTLLSILFYAILLQAILSWFKPSDTPATQVLRQLSSTVLQPLQRIIPPVGGFDITPIPALLILQLLIILIS